MLGLGTVPAFGTFHPMDAAQKLKIALDETRMLILGAQVLLGFQMSSVFQDAFEQIPTSSKQWDAVALLLMVAVVGFLIAPAAQVDVLIVPESTPQKTATAFTRLGVEVMRAAA